jgi:hypothetical protein
MEERGRRQGQEHAEPSGRPGFREKIAAVGEAAPSGTSKGRSLGTARRSYRGRVGDVTDRSG